MVIIYLLATINFAMLSPVSICGFNYETQLSVNQDEYEDFNSLGNKQLREMYINKIVIKRWARCEQQKTKKD